MWHLYHRFVETQKCILDKTGDKKKRQRGGDQNNGVGVRRWGELGKFK